MTTTVSETDRPETVPGSLGLRRIRWHRPLLVLAGSMVVLALVSLVGLLVDDRQVTGLDVWSKPLKFALSTGIYAVTLAWLIGQLDHGRRLARIARIAGTVSAIGLGIELIIITGFAAAGDTSHFNVSTPLHTVAWAVMAGSIGVVWVMTLVVAVALFRTRVGDPARTLAIRAGAVLAIIGMGLAFLMTGPTADQLSSYQGIVGAHTVGVPDGGPGLPLLGWSTVAGDLRIPHFIGMHALQVLPIVAIVLELIARRSRLLTDGVLRLRLVAIATATYAAVIALATWQALSGQSIVHPEGAVLVAGVGVAVAVVGAVVVVVGVSSRRSAATRPPV